MISWLSSWAESIIVAIIIATILEMILPDSNNKKYVKTIIGIYILFVIVSPIISKFTNKNMAVSLDYEKYFTNESNKQAISKEIETNNDIEKVYLQNIKADLKNKLENKGYVLIKSEIEVNLEDEKNYGNINQMKIKVEKTEQSNNELKPINTIEKVNITISNKIVQERNIENTITEQDKRELKKYIGEEYGTSENNVIIE